MVKQIVLASKNFNTYLNFKEIISKTCKLITLIDLNINENLPNHTGCICSKALEKAKFIYNKTGLATVAKASCITLNAGKETYFLTNTTNNFTNTNTILKQIKHQPNKLATLKSNVTLYFNNTMYQFNEQCIGYLDANLINNKSQNIENAFVPFGCNTSLASLNNNYKKMYSPQFNAFKKLNSFLNTGLLN
jgi:XTP/dITP diphosphohydrolase